MAQAKKAIHKVTERSQISAEIQAEIERIGNSNPYLETDREPEFYAWLDEQRTAKVCGLALEDKGSGLSKACQFYRLKSVRQRRGLIEIPLKVLYVKASQPGAARHLFIDILEALNRPLKSGHLRDLRSRVRGTLKSYQVQLLLVDDAHVLERQAMTELVKIFDDLRLPVVMAGIYDLDRVLDYKGYEHIYNTFLEAYDFRALSKSEVEAVAYGWEEQILKDWSEKLNLTEDEDILDLLHDKSGGLVQPLYESLRKIAIARLTNSLTEISYQSVKSVLGRRRPSKLKKHE